MTTSGTLGLVPPCSGNFAVGNTEAFVLEPTNRDSFPDVLGIRLLTLLLSRVAVASGDPRSLGGNPGSMHTISPRPPAFTHLIACRPRRLAGAPATRALSPQDAPRQSCGRASFEVPPFRPGTKAHLSSSHR